LKTRTKIIILVVALIGSFALGRYTVPEKKIEEKKTTEDKTKDVTKEKKQKKHKKTHIVKEEKTAPDGSKTVVTIIDHDTKTDTSSDSKTAIEGHKTTEDKVITVRGDSKVTLSALGGIDILSGKPIYGASLTKPVLGPLTLGIFGLSNGSVGASIGFTF